MNAVLSFIPEMPRWVMMWLICITIYGVCKWMTWKRRVPDRSSRIRQAGYLLAWPGLDPESFLGGERAASPLGAEWIFALSKMFFGLVLFIFAAREVPTSYPYLQGWMGMLGLIFTLHFGLFHLVSCAWRKAGVVARPLMVWPIGAVSVSDFWGRRWNLAFRDLVHRFLFCPVSNRCGVRTATGVVFLASGLIHDAVISIPAGGGYGRPTLFFVIQCLAMFFERSASGRSLRKGPLWRMRLFTLIVLTVPIPLLFHPTFVANIILPMMRWFGAIEG